MKMLRSTLALSLLGSVALAAPSPCADAPVEQASYPFTKIVAFGDELSDNGNGSFAHGITGNPATVYGFGKQPLYFSNSHTSPLTAQITRHMDQWPSSHLLSQRPTRSWAIRPNRLRLWRLLRRQLLWRNTGSQLHASLASQRTSTNPTAGQLHKQQQQQQQWQRTRWQPGVRLRMGRAKRPQRTHRCILARRPAQQLVCRQLLSPQRRGRAGVARPAGRVGRVSC